MANRRRTHRVHANTTSDGVQIQPLPFPGASAGWLPTNLPLALSSFVGRDRELRELRGLARAHRLLTLTGVGGVGKSRLALCLAEERARGDADGAWLVDLTTVEDPDLVPAAVATALGIQESPGQDHLESLAVALRQRSLLLVLDNCEHVLVGASRTAEALLRSCKGVRIVATSRQPLRIDGEAVWIVPPLSNPPDGGARSVDDLTRFDAALLFLERARAVRPSFTLTDEGAGSIIEICRRLDGLPLALELAAARLRSLGIAQIATRLEHGLDLLSRGPHSASPRHQTLRATLDWSHETLSPDEQIPFRRLAVFSGSWTMEAAEAICAADPISTDTLETLSNLVDHSLVVVDDWAGQSRYRFLETIRHYALERLAESGEEGDLRRRHLEWCAEIVRHEDPWFGNAHQAAYLERIDTEIDNIRAGLAWSVKNQRSETAVVMSTEMLMFWHSRGLFREGRSWLEAALELSPDTPSGDRACGLGVVGYLAFMQGDVVTTEQYCGFALECARLAGDAFSISMSLLINGAIARFRGAFAEAHAVYDQALALAPEKLGDYVTMTALYHMGELARLETNYDRATQLYEESEAVGMRHGDDYNRAYPAFGLGHIALLRGDFSTATSAYRRTLASWQDLKDRGNIRWALEGLGWCASFEGRAERAARLLGAAEALGELLGTPLVPQFMADHDRAIAQASAALGEQAFAQRFEAGRALRLEAALREALEQVESAHDDEASASWSPLTEREREVAQLVANGLSNRSIAETLVLGTRTIESHISRILSKLRLSSRAQLAVWADKRMSLGPQRPVERDPL